MIPGQTNLPETLPALRPEIEILEGGRDFNGAPTWLLEDPVSHQTYHLGWNEYQLLRQWGEISPQALIERVKANSVVDADEEMVNSMLQFLRSNCLVMQPHANLKRLHRAQNQEMHWLYHLSKRYLFFRVPIVRPNAMLDKLYPRTKWLFSRTCLVVMIILAIVGLLILQRHIDQFKNTFFELFSLRYIILFAIAIIIAKVFHELGHALSCKRHGLNIPTMGVAFLVLFPMLYTDTHQSWRLSSPKARVKIALAGVWMEVYLAIIALWLWLFLPNGALRSICFFIATYNLIATILINISPFLRFDGYFVLSDCLSMRNLQTRSFALCRWHIRKLLFGWKQDKPESFSPAKERGLLLYALCTWLYRFVLFLAIAVMVYYLFFKLLGVVLFLLEIYWFILAPIVKEVQVWLRQRHQIHLNKHTLSWLVILLLVLVFLCVPWKRDLRLPATLSYQHQYLFVPDAAQVESIHIRQATAVKAGQTLIQLRSPKLSFEQQKLEQKRISLQVERRNIGHYQSQNTELKTIQSQLSEVQQSLLAITHRVQALTLKAPIDGTATPINPNLHVGQWIPKNQPLYWLGQAKQPQILALANDRQIGKLSQNLSGTFVPDNLGLSRFAVTVKVIRHYSLDNLSQDNTLSIAGPAEYHASVNGGDVPSYAFEEQHHSENNLYSVNLAPKSLPLPTHYPKLTTLKGTVFVAVKQPSLLSQLFHSIYLFIVKESVF